MVVHNTNIEQYNKLISQQNKPQAKLTWQLSIFIDLFNNKSKGEKGHLHRSKIHTI